LRSHIHDPIQFRSFEKMADPMLQISPLIIRAAIYKISDQ